MIQEAEGKGPRLRTTEITLNCPLMVNVIEDLKNISTRMEYKSYLAKYLGEFSCHVREDENLPSNREKSLGEKENGDVFQDLNSTGIELEAQHELPDGNQKVKDKSTKGRVKRPAQEDLLEIEEREEV